MKITDVNAYVVTPPGHGYGGAMSGRDVCEVDTDEGFMAGASARTIRAVEFPDRSSVC